MYFYVNNNRKQYSLKSGITKLIRSEHLDSRSDPLCIGLHIKFWWRGNTQTVIHTKFPHKAYTSQNILFTELSIWECWEYPRV